MRTPWCAACLTVTMIFFFFFFCSCWRLAERAEESKGSQTKVLRSWQHSQLTAHQFACSAKLLWTVVRSRQAANGECCLLCSSSPSFHPATSLILLTKAIGFRLRPAWDLQGALHTDIEQNIERKCGHHFRIRTQHTQYLERQIISS